MGDWSANELRSYLILLSSFCVRMCLVITRNSDLLTSLRRTARASILLFPQLVLLRSAGSGFCFLFPLWTPWILHQLG